eukprot:4338664-Pyramimonas_sp.AAC.1
MEEPMPQMVQGVMMRYFPPARLNAACSASTNRASGSGTFPGRAPIARAEAVYSSDDRQSRERKRYIPRTSTNRASGSECSALL